MSTADPRHSATGLDAIRGALDDACGGRAPASDLLHALLERRHEIDGDEARLVLRCLAGLLAVDSGATPRSIFEAEFAAAPSDDFWRADLSAP
jgi:hypothetical protein